MSFNSANSSSSTNNNNNSSAASFTSSGNNSNGPSQNGSDSTLVEGQGQPSMLAECNQPTPAQGREQAQGDRSPSQVLGNGSRPTNEQEPQNIHAVCMDRVEYLSEQVTKHLQASESVIAQEKKNQERLQLHKRLDGILAVLSGLVYLFLVVVSSWVFGKIVAGKPTFVDTWLRQETTVHAQALCLRATWVLRIISFASTLFFSIRYIWSSLKKPIKTIKNRCAALAGLAVIIILLNIGSYFLASAILDMSAQIAHGDANPQPKSLGGLNITCCIADVLLTLFGTFCVAKLGSAKARSVPSTAELEAQSMESSSMGQSQ